MTEIDVDPQAVVPPPGSPDWESLARAANPDEEARQPELLQEFLTLLLAGAPYAIPVERVREIVRLRPITPMPRVPTAILGALALRGEIVQVVDLRVRLDLAAAEPTRESRMIILHGDDDRVTGVLVDSVQEVLRVGEAELRPAQATSRGFVKELAVRDGEFVSVIDVDRVLDLDAE